MENLDFRSRPGQDLITGLRVWLEHLDLRFFHDLDLDLEAVFSENPGARMDLSGSNCVSAPTSDCRPRPIADTHEMDVSGSAVDPRSIWCVEKQTSDGEFCVVNLDGSCIDSPGLPESSCNKRTDSMNNLFDADESLQQQVSDSRSRIRSGSLKCLFFIQDISGSRI